MPTIPITASNRLRRDYMRIKKDPVPFIDAEPLPNNILEWHYVVIGPEDSLYKGGYYHGKLVFPKEFPFKPPRIFMITPNGRFQVNTRLCLSISDYHPDSWNPAWSVSTILTGLLSFMLETSSTLGSIETSHYSKKQFADMSLSFNLQDTLFVELFPEMSRMFQKMLIEKEDKEKSKSQPEKILDTQEKKITGILNNSILVNAVFIVCLVLFGLSARHILLGVMDE